MIQSNNVILNVGSVIVFRIQSIDRIADSFVFITFVLLCLIL